MWILRLVDLRKAVLVMFSKHSGVFSSVTERGGVGCRGSVF